MAVPTGKPNRNLYLNFNFVYLIVNFKRALHKFELMSLTVALLYADKNPLARCTLPTVHYTYPYLIISEIR